MPTFQTPGPVALTVSLVCGDLRIVASDRTDTIVEVRPANNSEKSEKMCEETTVDYADGRLTVKTPKTLSRLWGRNTGAIAVGIQVPAGSRLDGDTGLGDLVVEGRLDSCRFKSGMGALRLGDTGRLDATTGFGDVAVVSVDGDAEVTTGSGELRVGRVSGAAMLKNSNGSIHVGELGKRSELKTSNGGVFVGRVTDGVTARTAAGAVRVREARSGEVVLQTGFGEIEVGIPEGTAAWLDLQTQGDVSNTLAETSGPDATDKQVKVRARTHFGNISIHRS